MNVKFAFGLRADGLFFLAATGTVALHAGTKTCSWTMTYDDEDAFLRRLAAADLDEEDTARLLVGVLAGVAQITHKGTDRTEVALTRRQLVALGMETDEPSHFGIDRPQITSRIKFS